MPRNSIAGAARTATIHDHSQLSNANHVKKLLCAILDLDPEKSTDQEIQAAAEKVASLKAVKSLSARITTIEDKVKKILAADPIQGEVNRKLGLTTEVFAKHNF